MKALCTETFGIERDSRNGPVGSGGLLAFLARCISYPWVVVALRILGFVLTLR